LDICERTDSKTCQNPGRAASISASKVGVNVRTNGLSVRPRVTSRVPGRLVYWGMQEIAEKLVGHSSFWDCSIAPKTTTRLRFAVNGHETSARVWR
jgi:hypothetical protein